MKKLLLIVFTLLITLTVVPDLSAQEIINLNSNDFLALISEGIFPIRYPTEFYFVGGGAKAEAMGNAFYAISDDVSALSWNPAGLYGQEKPVFGLGYSSFSPSSDVKVPELQQSFSLSETFSGISLLNFSAPVRIKGHPFTIAASYTRTDDEFSFNESDISDSIPIQLPFTPVQIVAHSLADKSNYRSSTDVVNFGFGTKLSQKSSVGAAVSVYTNQSTSAFSEIEKVKDAQNFDLQIVSGTGTLSILDTSKYSGVSFTIGYKFRSEQVSAGLVIRSPFTLEQETNRTFFTEQRLNNLLITGSDLEIHFDRILSKIDIPITIGGGVAYNVNENLLVAADFDFRPFSGGIIQRRISLEIIPGEKDRETFITFDPDWKDVFSFRIGSEYQLKTTSKILPLIPIRAGFGYLPTPTKDINGDQVVNNYFSFGTGVRWSQIYIDAAYSLTTYDITNGFSGKEFNHDNGNLNFTFTGFF